MPEIQAVYVSALNYDDNRTSTSLAFLAAAFEKFYVAGGSVGSVQHHWNTCCRKS